jgi:hypothetical protein
MRQLALIIYSNLILRARVRIAHTSADSPHGPEKGKMRHDLRMIIGAPHKGGLLAYRG